MVKSSALKNNKKITKRDYFKLPFEVHYQDSVEVTQLEFKSDIEVKGFSDIKIVHEEQGCSSNPIFLCEENNGPELYCCIINGHDEVEPAWLQLIHEDECEFNYASDYKIIINNNEVCFKQLSSEDMDETLDSYLNIEIMDHCCDSGLFVFEIVNYTPSYLILDALDSRLKVNLDGYVLDENDETTDQRIFIPDLLGENEDLHDFSTREMWEAKSEWIKSVLDSEFPQDKNLKLSFNTH